jgi:hypothetical protein
VRPHGRAGSFAGALGATAVLDEAGALARVVGALFELLPLLHPARTATTANTSTVRRIATP